MTAGKILKIQNTENTGHPPTETGHPLIANVSGLANDILNGGCNVLYQIEWRGAGVVERA